MAFWGIEVKPGKPYTHLYDNSRGRLRICQATLGNGKSASRSVVQCNVGDKSPVLLCSLIPEKVETCHLELEFEEDDEVVFSVLGQASVHLSGYYAGRRGHILDEDEIDSYGEDIAGSDTSGSYDSLDDEYESDFIDDNVNEIFPHHPHRKSGVVIEEIIEDEKPSTGNAGRRRLKKKHQLSDSDDHDIEEIIEDEKSSTGNASRRRLKKKHQLSDSDDHVIEEIIEDEKPSTGNAGRRRLKKKHQLSDSDDHVIEEIREDEKPSTGNAGRRRLKKKHHLSDSDDHDDSKRQLVVKQNNSSIFESEDEDGFPISMHSRKKIAAKGPEGNSKSDDMAVDEDKKQKIDVISQDGESAGEPADTLLPSEIGVENDEKLKKRKKVKDGKTLETATKVSAEERVNDKLDKDQKKEVKKQKVESSGIETDVTENDSKPKKKKKGKKRKKSETDAVGPVKQTDEHAKEKTNEPGKLPTENAQESSVKSRKRNRKRKGRDGNSEETEKNADAMELQKSNAVEQLSNVSPGVEADKTTDDDQKDAKGKKKKNKNIVKDSVSNLQAKVEAHSHKPRTFANGLVIEELAMGKPDGKRADDGSKVSVNYIGKLKNGTIFDSNVGQRPFKFRLGVGQVIKGWDVGVKGMRIGDKRRLTIPPSFGYGESGAGNKIPGNSWLVFDVELVGVQ